MTRSFIIRQGEDETPEYDLTEPTSNVHVDWPNIEAGGRAFRGEANMSTVTLRDEQGETGNNLNLPGGLTLTSISRGSKWEWLEGSVRMAQGRVGTKDYSRGRQKADRARELVMMAADANENLKLIIVDDWVRPAETDVERVNALITDYLSGSPRPTTVITNDYVASGNTINLEAKTYDGTDPYGVLSEVALLANKNFFITVDDEMFYDTWDSTAYESGLRISDREDEWRLDIPCPDDYAAGVSLGSNATLDNTEYSQTEPMGTGPLCERVQLEIEAGVSPGDSIVVLIAQRGSAENSNQVVDTAGNTYTLAGEHSGNAGGQCARIYYSNVQFGMDAGDFITYEVDIGAGAPGLEAGGKAISARSFSGFISGATVDETADGFTSTPALNVGAGAFRVACMASGGGATGFPDTITTDTDWDDFDQAFTPVSSSDAIGLTGGYTILPDADAQWNATIDQNRDVALVGVIFEVGPGEGGEGKPTFGPIWDVGPSSTEDGLQLLCGLRLYYGQQGAYVYLHDATTHDEYWHAEESLYTSDPAIDDATKAMAMAEAIHERRKREDRTYNVSIGPLTEMHIGCIKYGQLINIKARAIPDADDQFVARRIAQLRWTTPRPGIFFARMQLDRPIKEAPYGVGPKDAVEETTKHTLEGSHPASNITIIDSGAYFTATDVEAALQELAADVAAGGGPAVVTDHGSMGATETFDFGDGSDHEGVQNADLVVTLTGATTGQSAFMTLVLTQDGTGGHSIDLPASVANAADVESAWNQTASATNILTVFSYDGGTTWYAFLAGSGAGATGLDDLSDVTITTPATADRLRYDGAEWVNTSTQWKPVTTYDGTNWLLAVDGDGNAIMTEG